MQTIPSEIEVVCRSWILHARSYSHGGLNARATINTTGSAVRGARVLERTHP